MQNTWRGFGMEIGMLVAFKGEFNITEKQLLALAADRKGLSLSMALDDGWIDPNYCKGEVVISKLGRLNKGKRTVQGTVVYEDKPRKISGIVGRPPLRYRDIAEKIYGKGILQCNFKFTEPA